MIRRLSSARSLWAAAPTVTAVAAACSEQMMIFSSSVGMYFPYGLDVCCLDPNATSSFLARSSNSSSRFSAFLIRS